MTDLLKDIWYFACLSSELKPGKMERRFYCGVPVVIGRDAKGAVFALRDVCPHRAAPLSAGRQVEEGGETTLECPYHGWRMKTSDGVCAKIPALSETSSFPVANMKTARFPLHEEKGTVWIYMPADWKRFGGQPVIAPPQLETAVGDAPKMVVSVPAKGPYDEAVIGLVDPAHTPFVHQQWFWRNPAEASEKVKDYEPTERGFRMKAHPPSKNGRAYRIIGGNPTTEIEFALPGLRYETIRNEKHTILSFTAITPTKDGESVINHLVWWDMTLLSIAKPFFMPLAKTFLGQDGKILSQQAENIEREKPAMMYVDDPDMLAKWYLKLKREWAESREQGRDFVNTLEPAQLRWRT